MAVPSTSSRTPNRKKVAAIVAAIIVLALLVLGGIKLYQALSTDHQRAAAQNSTDHQRATAQKNLERSVKLSGITIGGQPYRTPCSFLSVSALKDIFGAPGDNAFRDDSYQLKSKPQSQDELDYVTDMCDYAQYTGNGSGGNDDKVTLDADWYAKPGEARKAWQRIADIGNGALAKKLNGPDHSALIQKAKDQLKALTAEGRGGVVVPGTENKALYVPRYEEIQKVYGNTIVRIEYKMGSTSVATIFGDDAPASRQALTRVQKLIKAVDAAYARKPDGGVPSIAMSDDPTTDPGTDKRYVDPRKLFGKSLFSQAYGVEPEAVEVDSYPVNEKVVRGATPDDYSAPTAAATYWTDDNKQKRYYSAKISVQLLGRPDDANLFKQNTQAIANKLKAHKPQRNSRLRHVTIAKGVDGTILWRTNREPKYIELVSYPYAVDVELTVNDRTDLFSNYADSLVSDRKATQIAQEIYRRLELLR